MRLKPLDTQTIIIAILSSGGLWAVISTLVAAWLDKRRAKQDKAILSTAMLETHGKALRGLLYGALEKKCAEYLKKGTITAAELNDLRKYYYEPYHDGLGGNGTIEKLFERVENLPVE